MTDVNDNLTIDEWRWLDTMRVSLDIPKPAKDRKPLDSLLLDARLSGATRRAEEMRLARLDRKRLAKTNRKPRDKRKKPWTAKQATARRAYKKLWKTRPYTCVVYGWGSYNIEKALWDKYIGPLWERYDPCDLKVVRNRTRKGGARTGSREIPYTIYDIDVVHSTEGRVYDGNSQRLFDLSTPNPPGVVLSG